VVDPVRTIEAIMTRLHWFLFSLFLAASFAGCSGGSKDKNDAGDGSGLSGPDSGQDTEGGGADASTGGDGGAAAQRRCPPEMQCGAIAGKFMCVNPATGAPPLCSFFGRCDVGQCTMANGVRYCVEPCAPEPVSECTAESECTAPAGVLICTLAETGAPPPCGEGEACPFGECTLYEGTSYCLQPCEYSVVVECPSDQACLLQNGVFVCASRSTGKMEPCNTTEDCSDGRCVHGGGPGNCVLPCEPSRVEACAEGATCRKLDEAFLCALDSSKQPPPCETEVDCEWGECVFVQGAGHCIQYCTDPLIEISGTVLDADRDPLSEVEICLLDEEGFACESSDADGAFLLSGVPSRDWYLLTFASEGYQPAVRLALAFDALEPTVLLSDEQASANMEAPNATYPETETGSITFSASTPNEEGGPEPLADFRVLLEPTPTVSRGPVYATEEQAPDIYLSASSAAGWGAFYNVTPGDYQLYFDHPSLTCGGPVPLRVVAGYMTSNVSTQCL
jgi:hypothetical protein